MHLGVCLPTRNRREALIESAASVVRCINSIQQLNPSRAITLFIRENSDNPYSSSEFFDDLSKFVESIPENIVFKSNTTPVLMSENWELVINDAITSNVSHVCVIADRRLLSKNIFRAWDKCIQDNANVLVFDNQAFWLSSKRIAQTRSYHSHIKGKVGDSWHLEQVRNCNFDNLTPRFYNCIVTASMLIKMKKYFSTFVGSPFPDLAFQHRLAFVTSQNTMITDIPVIMTNARHACLTASQTGVDNKTSVDKKNVPMHHLRGFMNLDPSIIAVACAEHMLQHISRKDHRLFLNPIRLLESMYWEMSCPQTQSIFDKRMNSIFIFLENNFKDFPLYTDERKILIKEKFASLSRVDAAEQRQPLDQDKQKLNLKSFDRLSQLEIP